jgi:ubiquinone/menaquinone biosynthesis C-methylase UbiE
MNAHLQMPKNMGNLISEQYKTSTNLDARIALHERFSTHSQPWISWVFEQFDLPAQACILEIGCGPAKLWQNNADRTPADWRILLTDFSLGMLRQAQTNLGDAAKGFQFAVANAGALPFDASIFDVVIANHMLYHVPDLNETLAEIKRVLKPAGMLYATTNGADHMHEMDAMIRDFDAGWQPNWHLIQSFMLESSDVLRRFFAQVEVRRQANSLHVTEAEPIAAYILSSMRSNEMQVSRDALVAFIQRRIDANGGAIDITKSAGMLVAQ